MGAIIPTRFLAALPLAAFVACASNPAPADPCAMTIPPVADWTSYDEGVFALQLPADYTQEEVQGIDSQVGRWAAPNKRVSYDLGPYSNPLRRDDINAFPGLVVCQESAGPDTPRIIRYSPTEGGYAVSAHWPVVGGQVAGMPRGLTIDGVVQEAEDQGELLAIIRSVRIESSATGADGADEPAADGSEAAPGAARPDRWESPDHAGYRAAGNEPFWTMTFGESTMDFVNLGAEDTLRAARPRPERLADGWRFTATADGQPFIVEIDDRRCGDSMSGRPFPHTVTVTASGRTFSGCGGDTASLLTGDEWRVTHLESSETTGAQTPTLHFAADGSLTGSGGCNRFRATYEISGEGVEIGPALATRMACADPQANAQETRFFALLEQVTRFDIAGNGSLRLLANDRPVIVARR